METQTSGSEDIYVLPVSYSQERLWFLDRFEPSSAIYNIPFIATVKGSVHRTAFNRAVNRLVQRHESLRTFFIENGGQAAQAIHGHLEVEVGWHDLDWADAATRPRELQGICTEATRKPFDLSKAPLFRIMVVSAGPETMIITTMHHIISDGWSIGVFQRNLSALYREELGGRPAALPELPIQYADYAVWQRENLRGDFLERRMAYWRQQLDGAPTILEIPGDYSRPLKQTFNGAAHTFELTPELASKVKALSLDREATLFMTLFSAFAVLLYRLSGQDDVLVGTPIAGRNGAELENLIGFFVNTLVLRARLKPGLSFSQLVADVKKTTLEAFQNQDVPFEKLVLELNPERTLSHSPLIQVLFSLQNIPALQEFLSSEGSADAGVSQNLDGHTGTAKFDFALFVSEVGDRLQCSIEFNTDLFSLATIQDISDSYVELVSAIVADPGASISSYPLMSAEKRAAALQACVGRTHNFAKHRGCHQLFEAQARTTPDAIAVAHASNGAYRRLTYDQLNADANRLARFLVAGGIQPGDKVGVCMERGISQITAVLAIVKAGAAYVPLDPAYPRERLNYILDDTDAQVVLSTTDTRTSLAGSDRFVMVDRIASELAGLSPDDLDTELSPDAALYVLHTSGSTGRPKGVVMPHRSIVNLVEWQARASGPETGAVTCQFASLSFDVASQEIFSTVTSGGRLELIDDSVRREGPLLLAFLAAQGVSRLFLPPVALDELANAAGRKHVPLPALREVIVAGDKLDVTDTVRAWFEGLPGVRLVNQYGPTETHVVTAHILDGPAAEWPAHPPIGRPIGNAELYVLDENLEPVPPMVTGELYVAGVSVALGYLNAPDQTKERFIGHPFAAGEVLYRTGDLCRYDRKGVVTFVGRADGQIKLRGYRIEPGEVEVALKQHRGAQDAVVVKRRSRLGEDQLVAYLVMDEGAEVNRTRLRSELGHMLPSHMIPTLFVRLASLPLTGSGKIDRLRLPEPEDEMVALERERTYVAPRTPAEWFLAECWCDLLQLDRVGVHDNFFDLGGHSLKATQLVSRIRDHFDLELPLIKVFERPTIGLLAVEIVQLKAVGEEEEELLRMLSELESLSEEESQALLSDDGESR